MTRTNAQQKNLHPGYLIHLHHSVNRKISITTFLLEEPFLGRDGFRLLWTFASHKKSI